MIPGVGVLERAFQLAKTGRYSTILPFEAPYGRKVNDAKVCRRDYNLVNASSGLYTFTSTFEGVRSRWYIRTNPCVESISR